MANTQAALLKSEAVKELVTEVLTDVLTTALHAKGIPVPRPVVRAAVARAVDHVADLDPDNVVRYTIKALSQSPVVKIAEYVLDADFATEASQALKARVPQLRKPLARRPNRRPTSKRTRKIRRLL